MLTHKGGAAAPTGTIVQAYCYVFTSEVTVTPNEIQVIRCCRNETKQNGLKPVKRVRKMYTKPNKKLNNLKTI